MGYEAFTNARDASLRNIDDSLAALESGRQAGVNRTAGNALQAGDYAGASNALFQGGNLQGGMAVQNAGRTRATADRDQQKAAIAGAVSGLLHVPEAQRAQMLQERIAPLFQELGLGEYLAQITPQDLTDASLRALTVSMGGEVETGSYMNAGNGRIIQTRPYGNGVDEVYAAPVNPLDEELKRAQIAATQAQVPLRQAQAERAGRPPAGRSGSRSRSGSGAPPAASAGRPWENYR